MEKTQNLFSIEGPGGEELALQCDHTVPLARHLAMAGTTFTNAKLWQVGKVYRRDNPVMSKGRMREFSHVVGILDSSCRATVARVLQDIDFAGSWDPMIPDAEIISLIGDSSDQT